MVRINAQDIAQHLELPSCHGSKLQKSSSQDYNFGARQAAFTAGRCSDMSDDQAHQTWPAEPLPAPRLPGGCAGDLPDDAVGLCAGGSRPEGRDPPPEAACPCCCRLSDGWAGGDACQCGWRREALAAGCDGSAVSRRGDTGRGCALGPLSCAGLAGRWPCSQGGGVRGRPAASCAPMIPAGRHSQSSAARLRRMSHGSWSREAARTGKRQSCVAQR